MKITQLAYWIIKPLPVFLSKTTGWKQLRLHILYYTRTTYSNGSGFQNVSNIASPVHAGVKIETYLFVDP